MSGKDYGKLEYCRYMISGMRPYHRNKNVLYRGGGLSFDFNNNNKLILNTENGLDNLLFVRGHT